MGKSILFLLILIITFVAIPCMGSFGEVTDQPVVVTSSFGPESLKQSELIANNQSEPSFVIPQEAEERVFPSTSYGQILESDREIEIIPIDPPEGIAKNLWINSTPFMFMLME